MSIPPSSAVNLPLPRWAYVPGETGEAEADQDTLWQAKALVPPRFRDFVPARHPALRYGIALNDSGYFWEAQEVLEAVWAAAPQGGRERILLHAFDKAYYAAIVNIKTPYLARQPNHQRVSGWGRHHRNQRQRCCCTLRLKPPAPPAQPISRAAHGNRPRSKARIKI